MFLIKVKKRASLCFFTCKLMFLTSMSCTVVRLLQTELKPRHFCRTYHRAPWTRSRRRRSSSASAEPAPPTTCSLTKPTACNAWNTADLFRPLLTNADTTHRKKNQRQHANKMLYFTKNSIAAYYLMPEGQTLVDECIIVGPRSIL